MRDLHSRKRLPTQFAAGGSNKLKGIKTIRTAVRIVSEGESATDEADGGVEGIKETANHILHDHSRTLCKKDALLFP